jgi:hypothetical protein
MAAGVERGRALARKATTRPAANSSAPTTAAQSRVPAQGRHRSRAGTRRQATPSLGAPRWRAGRARGRAPGIRSGRGPHPRSNSPAARRPLEGALPWPDWRLSHGARPRRAWHRFGVRRRRRAQTPTTARSEAGRRAPHRLPAAIPRRQAFVPSSAGARDPSDTEAGPGQGRGQLSLRQHHGRGRPWTRSQFRATIGLQVERARSKPWQP